MSESTTEMTGVMIDPVTGEIIDQKELAGGCSRRPRNRAGAVGEGVMLFGLVVAWSSFGDVGLEVIPVGVAGRGECFTHSS